jgi:hypothetical protein
MVNLQIQGLDERPCNPVGSRSDEPADRAA